MRSERRPVALVFGEELPLRAAIRVASCQGYDVVVTDRGEELGDRVAELRPTVVLFHWQHGGASASTLAGTVARASPRTTLVVLADPSPPPGMERLLAEGWFEHLLGLQGPWFMEHLTATLAKLNGAPLFGLRTLLPWGTRVESFSIAASDDKDAAFARIEAFMEGIGIRGRLVARLQGIADEMLMNAVYDAPVNRNSGAFRFAELERSRRVELEEADRPVFSFASDGRTFGLGISDPFGGLMPETLKRYVAKGLRRGDDQIDDKADWACTSCSIT